MKESQRKEFIRKVLEEVDLHYKSQKVFKELYNLPFEYMNERRINLYFYYKSECYLHNLEPCSEEYELILKEIKKHCENTFYKIHIDNSEEVTFFIF